jgi:hypothetical protein
MDNGCIPENCYYEEEMPSKKQVKKKVSPELKAYLEGYRAGRRTQKFETSTGSDTEAVSLRLPASLVEKYEAVGILAGVTPEEAMKVAMAVTVVRSRDA